MLSKEAMSTKANSTKTKDKDLEFTRGQTTAGSKAGGTIINSTALASTSAKKPRHPSTVFGKWANALSGFQSLSAAKSGEEDWTTPRCLASNTSSKATQTEVCLKSTLSPSIRWLKPTEAKSYSCLSLNGPLLRPCRRQKWKFYSTVPPLLRNVLRHTSKDI